MAESNNGSKGKNYLPWLLALASTLLLLAVVIRQFIVPSNLLSDRLHNTTITNSLIVERIQKAAKLVSSEVTVRDVIVYENTWYGSTKRSLVVVTGKILAGIDLDAGHEINIDEKAKRISITLPQASILAIEIVDMKTYDEQSGFWNPFSPKDRDAVFQLARKQFEHSWQELKVSETAQQSAEELLKSMFSKDGYTVSVKFHQLPLLRN